MTEAIRGFWVASATPLAADGSVDSAKLAAHANQLFGKGVDGVVLFGTTGEGTSFNVTERVATIEAVLKAGVAPERIGIGGGFPAITDSIALSRAALGLGLRHVLLLPPYFDRGVTAEGDNDGPPRAGRAKL
ncbi:dihydrodipicolinate synthase family protein [Bradyrhizobium sp. PRIMUS42]|nr:dihydrodipicolinate synthase family protein [Bradyrhizobium sp. PRIMUS42]